MPPDPLLPPRSCPQIVPFVSKRSTGLVSGFVGAGGNAGGAVTQAVFFTYSTLPADKAFIWMGVMAIGMTALYLFMYFPMVRRHPGDVAQGGALLLRPGAGSHAAA